MIDIATPLSFGGFSRATLEAFAPQLRALGLEPRQGIAAGGQLGRHMGNPADLKPGSMISVQLMSGDMSVGADGTVTYIDGNRIYAFGHRFLGVGATALPFARAEVIALLPTLNTSFKLSTAQGMDGHHRPGRRHRRVGRVGQARRPWRRFRSRVSRERPARRYLPDADGERPAAFAAADADGGLFGDRRHRAHRGRVQHPGERRDGISERARRRCRSTISTPPITAPPRRLRSPPPSRVAYVMQSGFDALRLKRVALKIEAFDREEAVHHRWRHRLAARGASRRHGAAERLLAGENGAEITRQVEYQVPIGAEPGTLYFTVADADTTNLADFRQVLSATPRTPAQLIAIVNSLHPNTKAYVRVWRADPAFQLEGADLPAPPPSVALILGGSQTEPRRHRADPQFQDRGNGNRCAATWSISGVKTIQVEIKE